MATAHDIGSPAAEASEVDALASTHRLRFNPPTYDGSYATFEEWKYKFSAYMGLQDNIFPQLLSRAERATTVLKDTELLAAAKTPEEGEKWTQLCNNLKYILINITSGAAATVCRQHQDAMGLEVYRQLCNRFAIPVRTRSIGYLTRLLKPKFDNNNFEESFSTWEFELARYERDNNAQLPDQVKIAVLMNETTGPLHNIYVSTQAQHPHYAEVRTTIMEYYRTTTAFSRLQQHSSSAVSKNLGGGPAPMDIGATYKGKGKGKNKAKGYGKGNKGKGYQQGKNYGGLNILGFFLIRFRNYFWIPASLLFLLFLLFLLLCFSAFLLFCFSCFSPFLLFCFSASPASLLFCFFAFLFFLFLCFSAFPAFPASLLFCFSCFFAFLLFCFCAFPVSLLLCFSAFFCFACFKYLIFM